MNRREIPNSSGIVIKAINNACTLANKEEKALFQLVQEVEEMNSWNLFWDSKVPEKEKWFFNCVSFQSSSTNTIMEEIEKYREFYFEMREKMRSARSKNGSIEELVTDLNEKLEEMIEKAEFGLESSDSHTLYKIHKDFIEKHDKLENIIRSVENVGLKQKQKTLIEKREEDEMLIEQLKEKEKKNKTDMEEIIAHIKEMNERSKKSHEENKIFREKFENVLKDKEELTHELAKSEKEKEEMKTCIDKNNEEIARSKKEQENILEQYKNYAEEIEKSSKKVIEGFKCELSTAMKKKNDLIKEMQEESRVAKQEREELKKEQEQERQQWKKERQQLLEDNKKMLAFLEKLSNNNH